MYKIITILSFVIVTGFVTLIAATPVSSIINTSALTYTGTEEKIVTIPQISLEGDSIGFWLDLNADSVSGYITYDWVTPYGNISSVSRTLTLSDGNSSFTNTGSIKAVFSKNITREAGVPFINLYLFLTNHKTEFPTQTITIITGKVTWR